MKRGDQHVHAALSAWLDSDSSAVLLGESVGANPSTEGLHTRFPDQVRRTPIADRTTFGLALGMAVGGRPVCVSLSSSRALLAVSEMLADAARLADSEFRPALTIRVPTGGQAGSAIDPAIGDVLAGLSGLRVVCSTASTASTLLARVLGKGVSVVLEPRAELARHAEAAPCDTSMRVLRQGGHVTIATWGSGVRASLAAAESLATDGVEATVIDLVSLSPLDPSLGEQVRATGRIVAAHDSDSPLASRVLRAALGDAFLYLESPPGDCPAHPDAVSKAVRDSVYY